MAALETTANHYHPGGFNPWPSKALHNKHPQITPHLVVRDADGAVDFYKRAFGAEVAYSSKLPGGMGMHYHIRIGGTIVMVTDEGPSGPEDEQLPSPLRAPKSLGGTSMLLEVYVDDADASFARAVKEGAHPTLQVGDAFWGDRYGWVTDPYGHIWALATMKEILTPEELAEKMAAMFGDHCHGTIQESENAK